MKRNYKKIFWTISLVLTIVPTTVFGKTEIGKSKAATTGTTATTEAGQAKITSLKTRGDREIDRRVASMEKMIVRINSFKRISSSQKTAYVTQIQQNITDLKALRVKIDADTELATLKTDVKSIVDSYRIFALFMPKIYILASADKGIATSDNLDLLYAKLDTRIQQAETSGKDVTALKTSLADMKTKIADARTEAQKAIDTVTPLNPEGYPGNKATLQSARATIKTMRQDLETARKDAKAIVMGLKALNEPTTSGSSVNNQ